MENKKESIYAKGLYFNKLKPETSEEIRKWKKGSVSIHIDNFVEQLKKLKSYESVRGYIIFDLVESAKDGEKFLSFKLNTWKPEDTKKEMEANKVDISPDDIPF
tara:strand:- start:1054 stop:1365 length:312 start_codon:yes stop_codon:yes gene_type:complete